MTLAVDPWHSRKDDSQSKSSTEINVISKPFPSNHAASSCAPLVKLKATIKPLSNLPLLNPNSTDSIQAQSNDRKMDERDE